MLVADGSHSRTDAALLLRWSGIFGLGRGRRSFLSREQVWTLVAGVAVLVGRLKMSVAVCGAGLLVVGGGVVWRRGCSGCLAEGGCWTVGVEDIASWF